MFNGKVREMSDTLHAECVMIFHVGVLFSINMFLTLSRCHGEKIWDTLFVNLCREKYSFSRNVVFLLFSSFPGKCVYVCVHQDYQRTLIRE